MIMFIRRKEANADIVQMGESCFIGNLFAFLRRFMAMKTVRKIWESRQEPSIQPEVSRLARKSSNDII